MPSKIKAFAVAAGITVVGIGAAKYYRHHALQSHPRSASSGPLHTVHQPWRFVAVSVKSNTPITHDTNQVVLELPEGHVLGGDVASSILFRTSTIRPYTPISAPDTVGSATFAIKKYPGGKSSTTIHELQPGQMVKISGPIQKYRLKQNMHKEIALIAGGAGITPMFQILQRIANDPDDKTKLTLYYGSKTPKDIILKKEIDSLVAKKPNQLKVEYFVGENPKNELKGAHVGQITKQYLKENMFGPKEDNVHVFVCGPPPFYKAISGEMIGPFFQGRLSGALKELGFRKDQVYKF